MMNSKRCVVLLAMAMAAAGCTRSVSERQPLPAPEDPAGRTAASILNECGVGDPAEKMGCHEAAVLDVLAEEGVAAAMAVAERMGDLDPEVRRQGHVYAHAIGLAAYTSVEEVGPAFASCTASYQSGCYHGVIQSYFLDVTSEGEGEIDAESINALCAGQRESGDRWLLFQCAHGVGHGVTMVNDHHLPHALEGCDLVASDWEREACYGGVFMENIVQATAPHHTVGRPQGTAGAAAAHDEHSAHHEVDAPTAAEAFPPLKPSEPLYPCTDLPERYLESCYHMQTSAILFFNGGDFALAGQACGSAPVRYRAACFRSLGRDVSGATVQNHTRALELCALMGDHRTDCHWGYVKNVIDVTARAEDGFAFCSMVPGDELKQRCYETVGEQVWVLAQENAGREAMCSAAESAYVDSCRRGAGLPSPAPRAPSQPGPGAV